MNVALMRSLLRVSMNFCVRLNDAKNALEYQSAMEDAMVGELQDRSKIDANDYLYGSRAIEIGKLEFKHPKTLMEEIEMSYEEYIAYLLDKYGSAPCDYFCSSTCELRNNRVDRSNEGLILHHMAEECGLSMAFETITRSSFAKTKPFGFYKYYNFVYCNYLEHLLLHLKITLDDINDNSVKDGIGADINGTLKIMRELNAFFDDRKLPPIKKKQAELVRDRYEDYLVILRFVANVLDYHNLLHLCSLDELAQDAGGAIVWKIKEDAFG